MLRRYTPPTCTLEINAKDSPLSRWAGQPVLKQLRFQLHFDDPRLPDEQRKTIQGDRIELETLCDVVSTYVQNFLEQTAIPVAIASSDREESLIESSLPSNAVGQIHKENVISLPVTADPGLHLKPKGLLAHHLFLGKLATEETGSVVDLTALQLFDLATALDEYAAEVIALPNLNRQQGLKLPLLKSPPSWAGTAAAMLLAVGITTAAIKLFDRPEPTTDAVKPLINPTPIAQATPTPAPTVSPLPLPSLLPTQPLPPPPTGVPTPPPSTSIQTRPIAPPVVGAPIPRSIPNRQIAVLPRTTVPPAPSNITPRPAAKSPQTQQPTRLPTAPPSLPSLPSLRSPNTLNQNAEAAPSATAARRAPENSQDAARNDADATLFDNIPQVAEARRFFQQRWRPPQGLTQTLEYNLLLNEDGTIQRIIPLGDAARTNVDSSGIPLLGEPFVSPISGGRTPKIRVVLSPDGKVQTFLEGT